MKNKVSNKSVPKKYNLHYEENRWVEYASEEYMVVVPKDRSELINEGKIQCHSLVSPIYAQEIEDKDKIICFIRKKTEPDKPYFAAEILTKDHFITEISGKFNTRLSYSQANDEKVIKFIHKWMKEKNLFFKTRCEISNYEDYMERQNCIKYVVADFINYCGEDCGDDYSSHMLNLAIPDIIEVCCNEGKTILCCESYPDYKKKERTIARASYNDRDRCFELNIDDFNLKNQRWEIYVDKDVICYGRVQTRTTYKVDLSNDPFEDIIDKENAEFMIQSANTSLDSFFFSSGFGFVYDRKNDNFKIIKNSSIVFSKLVSLNEFKEAHPEIAEGEIENYLRKAFSEENELLCSPMSLNIFKHWETGFDNPKEYVSHLFEKFISEETA